MGNCLGCGVVLAKDQQSCPYCGRPNEIFQPPRDATRKTDTIVCPRCHLSDRISKVTEIRRQDIQQLKGTMPVSNTYTDKDGRSHSYTTNGRFTGTQSSNLANDLTPPSEPQPPKKHRAGTWWLLAGVLYLGLGVIELTGIALVYLAAFISPQLLIGFLDRDTYNGLTPVESRLGPALIVVAIIVIIVWVFLLWSPWKKRFNREKLAFPTKTQEFYDNHAAWGNAMKRWQRLFYCYRDGYVFVPEDKDSAPVDKLMEYLYR